MKQELQQYCGRLSTSEIADGINAAKQNAKRLTRDAQLLFDNQSYPSAIAMAVLSIEEAGKAFVLRELVLARNEDELKKSWRDYRTHTKKNALWPMLDAFLKGARKARDFMSLLDPGADHPQLLDRVKQISLYTDCFRKGHWSIPSDVVTKELAEALLRTAEIFAASREVKTEEIDLWVEYLGPVWKHSPALMDKALFEWHKEIRRRGLVEEGQTVTMETFFNEGFPSAGSGESKQ